jgi:hypothetical protein
MLPEESACISNHLPSDVVLLWAPPSWYRRPMNGLIAVLGVGGFVAFAISIPIVVSYLLDRRTHDGIDWFKRRRVLKEGQAADARVLSSTLVIGKNAGGSKYQGAYSIVYEVLPAGAAPFRAKAIEVLYFSEASANRLTTGQIVHVRFDPADQTVVLVRVDPRNADRNREAERIAKENALLRGH